MRFAIVYQLLAVSGLLLFSFMPLQVTAKTQKECLPAGDDSETFHCLNSKRPPVKCEDSHDHEECQSWAKRGECQKNPAFMIKGCKQSCGTCLDLHVGEVQVAPHANTRRAVLDRLVDTRDYIYTAVEANPAALRKCKNEHEMCTYWAVLGECDTNAGFMSRSCSAACRNCH